MIPVKVDWRALVNELYDKHYSYKRLLIALADYGVQPDYSTLSHLRNGYAKRPTWELGAALMNLYAEGK